MTTAILNTVLNIKFLEKILYQSKKVHELRLEFLDKFGDDNVE